MEIAVKRCNNSVLNFDSLTGVWLDTTRNEEMLDEKDVNQDRDRAMKTEVRVTLEGFKRERFNFH